MKTQSVKMDAPIDFMADMARLDLKEWEKINKPRFRTGDTVFIDPHYGSDYWGFYAKTRPSGIYQVVCVLKNRVNYDYIVSKPQGYQYRYVICKKEEYEIAEETIMRLHKPI